MFKGSLLFAVFTALVMLLSPPVSCKLKEKSYCEASSCGNIHNISYPFRLKGDPSHCGLKKHELSCDENNRTILQLYSGRFYVMAINYSKESMQVVDPGIQKDNCSAWPLYSLTQNNFTYGGPYNFGSYYYNSAYTFVNCATQVNSTRYIDTAVCNNENASLSSSSFSVQRHSYVVHGTLMASELDDSCIIGMTVWASNQGPKVNYTSFRGIHDALVYGFDIFYRINPNECFSSSLCGIGFIFILIGYYASMLIVLMFVARALCGIPCYFAFLVYKWRRRHLSMFDSIEDFIQSHNNLMPVRYSYSDIKKMTKGFKDKLGEGGYGCVYKGKLRSGHLVAVKILDKSKANGQDFVNEVATIGRIHHVNVVQLIGFCAERSKRALVYEFMPNGSLEKYIFPREEKKIFLSCEKLYEISLGVAYGIEYLHRGCDMQILHFDIKPHNILLDEKFIPKVSDFGLAKLYPTSDSIVNLTAARGTMGYMAPELFYKNIGGVSYKADVYSFGMLLMEMASKRKNLNPFVEHLSQIYFPSWVYDQFNDGNDIEMGDATEEERKIVMKMIIVALWCIQMKPTDRPSMRKVVQMLEGTVELQMPPKPLLSPQEMHVEDHGINPNPTESPNISGDSSDSISLIVNAD